MDHIVSASICDHLRCSLTVPVRISTFMPIATSSLDNQTPWACKSPNMLIHVSAQQPWCERIML